MNTKLALAACLLGFSLLGGCAGNPYDEDPLLEPPQLVEVEKKKKS